ncbi:MAG: CHAT domain-containing protein [Acidobacteria bacterium]|nr:CHAT domain-containing protein [Acidobacteriota bacterium]
MVWATLTPAAEASHDCHAPLRVAARAGQFLSFSIEQGGFVFRARILSPDGSVLQERSDRSESAGYFPLSAVTTLDGEHRFELDGARPKLALCRVTYFVRDRIPTDENTLRGERALAEGSRLSEKGDTASVSAAIALYKEAEEEFRAAGLVRWQASAALFLTSAYYSQRDSRQAIEPAERALRLARSADDRHLEATASSNLGVMYAATGRSGEAIPLHRRAVELTRQIASITELGRALNNLGTALVRSGNLQSALEALLEVPPLLRSVEDIASEASAHNNIAIVYLRLGEVEKSAQAYQSGLACSRQSKKPKLEAQILSNLVTLYWRTGERSKALEFSRQAVELYRSQGDEPGEATALQNAAFVVNRLGRPREALPMVQRSVEILRKSGDVRGEATALSILGDVQLAMRDAAGSIQTQTHAIEMQQRIGDQRNEAYSHLRLAQAHLSEGRLLDAGRHVDQGIELHERQRSQLAGEFSRNSVTSNAALLYQLRVHLLMQLHGKNPQSGYDVKAFEAAESGRGRSLVEMIRESRSRIREGADPGLLRELNDTQQLLSREGEKLTSLLATKQTPKAIAGQKILVGDLTARYHQLEADLRRRNPRYAGLIAPQPLTLAELRSQALDADTVLLEYSLGESASYLFAVTTRGLLVRKLPPRQEIDRLARLAYQRLSGNQPGAQASLAALSRVILHPVNAQIAGKRIVIVAEGILQTIPFAALPLPGSSDPLIVKHEVVSLPSASLLAEMRTHTNRHPISARPVAVFADPVFDPSDGRLASMTRAVAKRTAFERLPGTRSEAEAIARTVSRADNLIATGLAASKPALLRTDLTRYGILHLATHGILNSEYPELSSLALSMVNERGELQNGLVAMHELFNLRLNAGLVVLSACHSALGKDIQGEGLLALTRAFLYAGSPRVVATLWQAPDRATSQLMQDFYRALITKGQRPAAALREAQLASLRSGKWSAPWFWAGFTLQGEWR